jgi:hypothetical protein
MALDVWMLLLVMALAIASIVYVAGLEELR